MQGSWLDCEAPKGAPGLETSDVETSQKRRQRELTARRPCRFQNQQKSEAKALMKLILGEGGGVGGMFLLDLFPSVCFCPINAVWNRGAHQCRQVRSLLRETLKRDCFFFLNRSLGVEDEFVLK